MRTIRRGTGVTETERYLARLADATFLDLWSYPNTFIDKRSAPGATGKELADLLVVCGDDLIIFSDKSIGWPPGADVNLCWSRWYRRAIEKSVDQIRGAERWLRDFPSRVFLDAACTERFPIELPPVERRRVHGIAVALGAQTACAEHFADLDGSLTISSILKGKDHCDPTALGYMPFTFGDVDPDGPFVHVFDETALDLVTREMDTVSDFVRYLTQREAAIRRGRIHRAASEAELVAHYLSHEDVSGRNVFPDRASFGGSDGILLAPGLYRELVNRPEYKAKKTADQQSSYAWDRLIGLFTQHILAGTSVAILGDPQDAGTVEPALRIMAKEDRVTRRALSQAFLSTLQEAERRGQDRFARIVLPNEYFADPQSGYVFMVLAYPADIDLPGGYEQYRRTRAAMLGGYCQAALYDNRNLKRMVGIAVDAPSKVTGRTGGSEDMVAVEVTEWTPDLERETEEMRHRYDILTPGRVQSGRLSMAKYPTASAAPISRQQRRAIEREARKRKPPPT